MKSFSKITFATLTMIGLTGLAVAGDPKADPKAPPKADPKAPAMAMPTAPDEIAAMAKGMTGNISCKGTFTGTPDGKPVPLNATYKAGLELNKFWIHGTYTAKMDKNTFQFEEYTTYDAGSKTWKRVMVMNDGGMMWGTAKADATKQEWEMTTDGPHGQGMFRDHVDMSDAKAGVKMKGEMSMDKGKTWMPVYEETCKK
jgi:hypothetical protein